MIAVPTLYTADIHRSLAFYTTVLDFTPRWPQHLELSLNAGVLDLIHDHAILQLSRHMVTNQTPSSVNLELATPADVDTLLALYTQRGLNQSQRANSPVHLAPLNQTGGTREFYIADPDNNTLCLRAWL